MSENGQTHFKSLAENAWFSLNNSQTVKAVTLPFYSIYQNFIKNICAKFGIPNLPQSLDIAQYSDQGISSFRISG